MAKLPSLKRVNTQDLQGSPSWVTSLVLTINNFFQVIYAALNHGLSFEDNFFCDIIEIDVEASSSDFTFELKRIKLAKGVVLLGVIAGRPAGNVGYTWIQNGNNITISNLSGLSANILYKLRFLVV